MFQRVCGLVLTLVLLASACADVLACGDKFLRVGRSARFRRYASVHPTTILVYAPRWKPHGITQFERMLARGGHKALTVTTADAMSQALTAGKYGVLIASYGDLAGVRKQIETIAEKPALLPLVYKLTKSEDAQAGAAYRCLLRPEKMTPFQALEEIDRLIDLRLKESAATVAAR